MPFDADIPVAQMSAADKLNRLADIMERLAPAQVDLRQVHHPCGAAHCAWGWGEEIGLFPKTAGDDGEDDAGWLREMESAEEGRSAVLGLTRAQFRHCFGMGYQFRHLGRLYTPVDVARHMRETAAALEA